MPAVPDVPFPARVTVSADPRDIAQVRAQAEKELETCLSRAIRRIESATFPGALEYQALRRRASGARQRLQAVMLDEARPWPVRVTAANALSRIGDVEGDNFLDQCLRSELLPAREAVLQLLRQRQCRLSLALPERAQAVLAQVADPQLSRLAAEVCFAHSIPGLESALLARFERGLPPWPAQAWMLACLATTPHAIQTALPHLFRERSRRYALPLVPALRRTLHHPDPEVREPLRVALRDYLLGFSGSERHRQAFASDLAEIAEPADIPALEDILKRAKNPITRDLALRGLARLQPERAVERILEQFSRRGPTYHSLETLLDCATEADAGRLLPLLVPEETEEPVLLPRVVARILLEKLGQAGRAALQANRHRLDADARMLAAWKLDGRNLGQTLQELHSAGVLALPPGELLARMSPPADLNDPDSFIGALSWAGLVISVRAEEPGRPCDYPGLLLELAARTGAAFDPEWPVQSSEGRDILVRFVQGERLFSFKAENRGSRHDLQTVRQAVNLALKEAGDCRRLLSLARHDRLAHFVLVEPSAFVPIAGRCGLVLGDEPA